MHHEKAAAAVEVVRMAASEASLGRSVTQHQQKFLHDIDGGTYLASSYETMRSP